MFDTARRIRPSRNRSVQVGDVRVTYVADGMVQLDPRWLGLTTAQAVSYGSDWLDGDGYLVGSVGALLIEHGDRRMLIDAGYGSHRVPAQVTPSGLGRLEGGALMDSLRRLGVTTDQIEAVAFTHLHDDHIGWIARTATDDRPTFEQAQYFTAEAEWSWWRTWGDPRKAAVLDKQLSMVTDGQSVFPGVTAWSTPGHTPGHTAYVVESAGERLVAFGDVMHSPIQLADPQWGSVNDFDRGQAVASRRAVLSELRAHSVTGFGGHFADVVFGSVVSRDDARIGVRWQATA